MFFKDISITFVNGQNKSRVKEAKLSISHVESIFLRLFGDKTEINNIKKLNIIIGKIDEREKEFWSAEGVGTLNVGEIIDLNDFLLLAQTDKERFALDLIVKSLCRMAENDEDLIEKIVNTAESVRRCDYKLAVELAISKTTPNRKQKACVIMTYQAGGNTLEAVLSDSEGELNSTLLDSSATDLSVFQKCYKSKWQGKNFVILGRGGEISYYLNWSGEIK